MGFFKVLNTKKFNAFQGILNFNAKNLNQNPHTNFNTNSHENLNTNSRQNAHKITCENTHKISRKNSNQILKIFLNFDLSFQILDLVLKPALSFIQISSPILHPVLKPILNPISTPKKAQYANL